MCLYYNINHAHPTAIPIDALHHTSTILYAPWTLQIYLLVAIASV